MVSSSRLGRFALKETVLHQSAQSEILDLSAGNVLQQVGLLLGSTFVGDKCSSYEVRGGGVCHY